MLLANACLVPAYMMFRLLLQPEKLQTHALHSTNGIAVIKLLKISLQSDDSTRRPCRMRPISNNVALQLSNGGTFEVSQRYFI